MLIKTLLLHHSFGPCALLSLFLSLSLFFRLIPWSAEALWVHFPAWASKTLWRRHSAPSPHWEGTWGLREQSKPHEGAFCFNQGISASFSLLCFLIGQLWTTRFWSIKGPQQQRVGHDWAHTWTPNFKFFKVIPVLIGKVSGFGACSLGQFSNSQRWISINETGCEMVSFLSLKVI